MIGHENFLNFARHVEIGLELGVPRPQLLGIARQLFGHSLALDCVAQSADEEFAFNLSFNQKILGAFMDGLDCDGIVI